MESSKTCHRCGLTKIISLFGVDRSRGDGLSYLCRACLAEQGRENYRLYRERCRRAERKYAASHRDEIRDRRRRYRATERAKAVRKAWAEHNKPKLLELSYSSLIKRRYGITPARYNVLLARQNGVCAICGEPPRRTRKERRLFVDHDHKTAQVRGLLCHRCNLLIGYAREDGAILENAMAYITVHGLGMAELV